MIQNSLDKANVIVDSFRKGDFQRIKEFVLTYPETVSTDFIINGIETNDPFYVIAALDSMASNFYFSYQFDKSLIFAYATYYCVKAYLEEPLAMRKNEILYYAGSSAYYILNCHLDTADYDNGIAIYQTIKQNYEKEIISSEFIGVQLLAVDLYLNANQPEQARILFSQIQPTDISSYGNKPYYDRLGEKIRRLFLDVVIMPQESAKIKHQKLKDDLLSIINSFQKSMEVSIGKPSIDETNKIVQLQDLIHQLRECEDEVEIMKIASTIQKIIAEYHSSTFGKNQEESIYSLRDEIRHLSNIVFGDASNDQLIQTENRLKEILEIIERKYPEDENYLLWVLGTCQGLIEQFEKAINTFEHLRENLESTHKTIIDKRETGGVFNQYPLLFKMLFQNYCVMNDSRGMLKTIEASKGYMLNKQSGESIIGYDNLTEKLEHILQKENVHYLSLLVDNNYTLSILVTAKGKYYIKGTDKINREIINQWIRKDYQNPSNWNNHSIGIFGKKSKTDISRELEDLLKVVKEAIKNGDICEDDHIVYSQDENLMLFPLHYARFNEKYLIETFSLSRIHNAFQLIALMDKETPPIEDIVCYNAPAKQDYGYDSKMQAFSHVSDWLQNNCNIPVTVQVPTLNNVDSPITQQKVVHFSTHGVFPNIEFDEFEKNNPFHNSGLLLNYNNTTPSLDINFDYYKSDNLLSPKKLIEKGDIFKQSHITFQACVSGRSKEGIAGDAIGMEWAAFFCGANSLLSAAWDVNIFWVNQFCVLFYENWLINKMSKAQAYTSAMRQLLKEKLPDMNPDVYYWGGMILSGNWKK